MNEKKIAFFIIILTFLHGIFSTGFMPILNKELGIESSLPFALYFLGILIGQVFIYKYAKLSYTLKLFCFYEILFALSLIFMAIFNSKFGFSTGRLLEGFFTGLSTPLLFGFVINLKSLGTESKRLAIFNSLNALGFILGPILVTQLITFFSYQMCLFFFAIFFIFISLIFSTYKTPDPDTSLNENLSLKKIFKTQNSFEKFYTFFLAKSFYGFLLTSIPSFLLLYINESISISKMILIGALIFVVGQIVIERTVKKFPKEHLENYLPFFLAISLILFVYTKSINFIYLASFFHSMLAFLAYLNFSFKSNSVREFALFNLSSDPGMVMGAFLATLGINGIWPIIFLMFIPIIKSILNSEQLTRAEKLFPFIGVITIFKIYKKHKNPLIVPEENIIPLLKNEITFNKHTPKSPLERGLPETDNQIIKLLFTGDFCPSNYNHQLSREIKEFIYSHDLRVINLESVQDSTIKQNSALHNLSEKLFENIIYPDQNKATFNLVSFVNNHVLDLGSKVYLENTNRFKNNNLFETFNSNILIKTVNNIKIGFFSLTFGNNFFWRKNDFITQIKPDDILDNENKKAKIEQLIKNYKSQVDILVLSYHWGYESEYLPSTTQKKCFEILREFGVDILYGHHSHIVQPFEVMNLENKSDSLCLYSCGNFITDPEMTQQIYNQGVFYSVEIKYENGCLNIIKVEPCFIESFEKSDNLKEIIFINQEQSLTYNNWLMYSKQ